MVQANREGEYVGEITTGKEIGLKPGKWAWIECPSCHKQRWGQQRIGLSPSSRLCKEPCLRDFSKATFKIKPE